MVEHLREFEPTVTEIGTSTWLNDTSGYQQIFPQR